MMTTPREVISERTNSSGVEFIVAQRLIYRSAKTDASPTLLQFTNRFYVLCPGGLYNIEQIRMAERWQAIIVRGELNFSKKPKMQNAAFLPSPVVFATFVQLLDFKLVVTYDKEDKMWTVSGNEFIRNHDIKEFDPTIGAYKHKAI